MNWEWKTDSAFSNAAFCIGWYWPDGIYLLLLIACAAAQYCKDLDSRPPYIEECSPSVYGVLRFYASLARSEWLSIVFWVLCFKIGPPILWWFIG